MESWSAEEDSFSFLHTVPQSFSLRNREGPNRVEIFDIISIPSQRSAISETTCLCDIFGDDCESPTLSSSPDSGSLTKKEVDDFTLADDVHNDSPGSYHTAVCSEQLSDSSETFEDSKETLSPVPPETAISSESRDVDPFPTPRVNKSSSGSKGTAPEPKSRYAAPNTESRCTELSLKHRGTTPTLEQSGTQLSSLLKDTTTPLESQGTIPSLEARITGPSTEPRVANWSPEIKSTDLLTQPRDTILSTEHKGINSLNEFRSKASSPDLRSIMPTPETSETHHSSKPEGTPPLQKAKGGAPLPKARATLSSPECCCTDLLPETRGPDLSNELEEATQLPKPRSPTVLLTSRDLSPEYSDNTHLTEPNDSCNLFMTAHECTDRNLSPKPCDKDTGRTVVVLDESTASEGLHTSQLQLTSDTVLIIPSENPEKAHIETEKCKSPPVHETQMGTNPVNILKKANKVSVTTGESPCEHPGGRESVSGEYGNQECWNRDGGGEQGAEDQWREEGEGKRGEASYREEQVELSFSARNRKVSASHSPPPTNRQLKSGIPARCYSEGLLATRQQQQNPLRSQSSQQENRSGARKPLLIPKTDSSSASCSAPDGASENSSMGSELDETDNEVKWITDLAFRSLSSPQVDYLDVYNSSHRSSTNVSQLSTEDSPGASAWSAYADLRGSARHESDDLSRQPATTLPLDRLDERKRFEMGSFECVDVVVESREEARGRKRTVPKRQIQLKRRDTSESRASENSEGVSEAARTHRHSKDIFLRQHSTPAAMQQELYQTEPESDLSERKQKLQKSVSLDETSSKTKTATCLIKNVLSKKMQHEHKLTSLQVPIHNGIVSPSKVMEKHQESSQSPPIRETPKMEVSNLSSGLPSDCSLSSEDISMRVQPSNPRVSIKQPGNFSSRPQQEPTCKPSPSPPVSGTRSSESQRNSAGRSGMRSELVVPFEGKKKEKLNPRDERKQLAKSNLGEKKSSDSANANAGNTSSAATRAPSTRSGMTNRNEECHVSPEIHKQQNVRNLFMSKTQEITLKPCVAGEKKKSSLKVACLSPDLETTTEEICEAHSPAGTEKLEEKQETKIEIDTTENWVANGKNKTKTPMHKVRDVRKLVKNTYNLSFKAPAISKQEYISQEQEDKLTLPSQPMQIECKAISRKEEKAVTCLPDERQTKNTPPMAEQPSSHSPPEKVRGTTSLCITSKSYLNDNAPTSVPLDKTPNSEIREISTLSVSELGDLAENTSRDGEERPKLDCIPKLPSKDREVSTLLLLKDGQTESRPVPVAPAPLSLTTTSRRRSVSTLLKEKGFQADIGFCDAPNDIPNNSLKHVNRLEVPLQTCSMEETEAEPQRENTSDSIPGPANTVPSTPILPADTRNKTEQKNSPGNREQDLEKKSLVSTERQTPTMSNDTLKTTVSANFNCIQKQLRVTSPPGGTKKEPESLASSNTAQAAVTATSSYTESSAASDNLQQPKMTSKYVQEQSASAMSSRSKHLVVSTTQTTGSTQQPAQNAPSSYQRSSDELHFFATDDPPSYDERESFSPLLLTDLSARKMNRYQPTSQAPLCSCTADSLLSPGHPSSQPPDLAAPVPLSMPAQDPPYPAAPPLAHQHRHRSDTRSLSYKSGSPQSTQQGLSQAPALFQPLQHPPAVSACPGSLLHPRPEDSRQPPFGQRIDRRAAHRRSPQQPTQFTGGGPYNSHAHSPNAHSMDSGSQYLCSPQGFTASFSPDYANEGTGSSGVLYPEGSGSLAYGQSPRRVLLDPETGKYFYIEVPVQPLRKMLFDPETGQYVEVLIPQQALSHSGLYPPSTVAYPPLHSPSMYAPQYLPYSVPPLPPGQGPRHPEAPAPPALHQNGAGYGSPGSRGRKSGTQNHQPQDQSYLESMYYIPTGMTASPNPATPDFFQKLPPSLPNSGGKMS